MCVVSHVLYINKNPRRDLYITIKKSENNVYFRCRTKQNIEIIYKISRGLIGK